jgi:hypothetical protein
MNLTISVPEASTGHGDPQLLCTPPRWYKYIVSFFTNYLAHATTVIAVPGQTTTETIFLATAALLAPSSGIFRAVEIFIRRPAFRMRNPLNQAAAAARALCMVVKTRLDEKGSGIIIDSTQHKWMKHISLVHERANIHGQSHLPEGYAYVYVPDSIEFLFQDRRVEDLEDAGAGNASDRTTETAQETQPENILQDGVGNTLENASENAPEGLPENMPRNVPENEPELISEHLPERVQESLPGNAQQNKSERNTGNLAASYNIPKAIISLAQAIWAIITIYRARGNQIDQYGYAAFGLTVAPYAYMSIINLMATCITPEYPAVYMVRTSLMNEAEAKGALITGEVGYLDLSQVDLKKDQDDIDLLSWCGFFLSLPPLIIVGALSHFSAGSSSTLERGFTMAWLPTGTLGGFLGYFGIAGILDERSEEDPYLTARDHYIINWIVFGLFAVVPLAAPAIGGFVVVSQMLREYGVCIHLP